MIITTITCDCIDCKADLTATRNSVGYRLSLRVQQMPNQGGTFTLLHVPPPIPEISGEATFCGLNCLDKWLTQQLNKSK